MHLRKYFKLLIAVLAVFLLAFFGLILINFLRFGYIMQEKPRGFLKIATKQVPGEPLGSLYDVEGKIKLSAEISEFKNCTPTYKKKWDDIAQKLIMVEEKLNQAMKQEIQNPIEASRRKMLEKLHQKQKLLTEELRKDPQFKKIHSQIDKIEKESYPLRLESSTFYKTKIRPLEDKQARIAWGQRGSLRNYLSAPLDSIIAKWYMKTRAYKDLKKQIQDLEKQIEPVRKKMDLYQKQAGVLFKKKQEIKTNIMTTSKEAQKLAAEIEILDKEYTKALKKSFDFQSKGMKKSLSLIKKSNRLRSMLYELFDKMLKA